MSSASCSRQPGQRAQRVARCTVVQQAPAMFVPHWLGTEAMAVLVVVALILRTSKIMTVCDILLLGVERYLPLTNHDYNTITDGAEVGDVTVLTRAKPKMTAVPRVSQKKAKKKAKTGGKAAKEEGGGALGAGKEAAGDDGAEPAAAPPPTPTTTVRLETDRLTRKELAEQEHITELYAVLVTVAVSVAAILASATERCLRAVPTGKEFISVVCLALVLMSWRTLVSFCWAAKSSLGGGFGDEIKLLFKLCALCFFLLAVHAGLSTAEWFEPRIDASVQLASKGIQQWALTINSSLITDDMREHLREATKAKTPAHLRGAVTMFLFPLLGAGWFLASFYPAVRAGRLYCFLMRRQPKEGMGKSVHRLGLLRRCMHWCNFHAPLVISLLWIPPLSSGLLPWVGFGWVTAEGFARGRLVFVLAAAVLRCYLLPQCVQQQLYLSVLLVSEATVMPATHVAVERLQLQIQFARQFTVGYAVQFACPAMALLGMGVVLWRRSATTLGVCDSYHALMGSQQPMVTSDPMMALSPVAGASLVGYLLWVMHLVWAAGLVYGRIVGAQFVGSLEKKIVSSPEKKAA